LALRRCCVFNKRLIQFPGGKFQLAGRGVIQKYFTGDQAGGGICTRGTIIPRENPELRKLFFAEFSGSSGVS
jgi:hypothetical protein